MVATITWLDASTEEQRRTRDIIGLFEQRDSRDELGLSQFRDAFSNGLFPGTTTLLTRARYYLFVSWAYSLADVYKDSKQKARQFQRDTIEALKRADDRRGLLGVDAGWALQRLPSELYWPGMVTYGIVTAAPDVSDVRNSPNIWHPGLPAPPRGFPKVIPNGFAMTHEEASWLRDRMATNTRGTLLEHLLYDKPDPDSTTPWEDSAAQRAGGRVQERLALAAAFSEVMHGAQLLYNLMLAEEYTAHGFEGIKATPDTYIQLIADWAQRITGHYRPSADLARTIRSEVEGIRSRPVNPFSATFVSEWFALIERTDPSGVVDNPQARDLVSRREKVAKGKQARLGNPKRLREWSGASGAGRLTYRWRQVRDILTDIHDGLDREESGTDA